MSIVNNGQCTPAPPPPCVQGRIASIVRSQGVIGQKRDVGRGGGGLDGTGLCESCSRLPIAWMQATVGTAVYGRRIRYSVGLHHWLSKGFEQWVVCVAINRAVPYQLRSNSIMEGTI